MKCSILAVFVSFVCASSSAFAYCGSGTPLWAVRCQPLPSSLDPRNLSHSFEVSGSYAVPFTDKPQCKDLKPSAGTSIQFFRNEANETFGLPADSYIPDGPSHTYVWGDASAKYSPSAVTGTFGGKKTFDGQPLDDTEAKFTVRLVQGRAVSAHVDLTDLRGRPIESFDFADCTSGSNVVSQPKLPVPLPAPH